MYKECWVVCQDAWGLISALLLPVDNLWPILSPPHRAVWLEIHALQTFLPD
jgi:hypothetical protein